MSDWAFPGEHWEPITTDLRAKYAGQELVQHHGMTLRDYFAAQAVAALVAGSSDWSHENISESAYAIADAMLKERAK